MWSLIDQKALKRCHKFIHWTLHNVPLVERGVKKRLFLTKNPLFDKKIALLHQNIIYIAIPTCFPLYYWSPNYDIYYTLQEKLSFDHFFVSSDKKYVDLKSMTKSILLLETFYLFHIISINQTKSQSHFISSSIMFTNICYFFRFQNVHKNFHKKQSTKFHVFPQYIHSHIKLCLKLHGQIGH